MISLLLLNNFYPVISYREGKESDEFWSLVMVRNRLPAQGVNSRLKSDTFQVEYFLMSLASAMEQLSHRSTVFLSHHFYENRTLI